ncbi:glutamyl-tRNA reductase [Oxobacter pfennigii]|uniref:Glutamyl-tRNA reductase n=1 Tax=Oxobacter pfennigii TaxID=36849 RepID=A0A0N8NT78_9CLOT|nr:prephenate dehydrogenase/arogenate dehydrogenase family protein [Oxobacter pfennigii]KPU44072.1 glutamyl-tRNA reductase [Oxobacter pfennigii]
MGIKKITVIGAGLIGGSLIKAFLSTGEFDVTCVDNDEDNLKLALNDGAKVISIENIKEAVFDCDLIFVCTPVMDMLNIIKDVISGVKKGCIISDAGSTKGWIMKNLAPYIKEDVYFIGGHPMAGSEKSGYINASANMFKGASYILIPRMGVPEGKVKALEEVISKTGALTVIQDEFTHDKWTASLSHLPYIVSICLSSSIDRGGYEDDILKMSAGSLRDMTRVSDSSLNMWRDICATNKEQIMANLSKFREELDCFTQILEQGELKDIENYIVKAKDFRQRLARIKGY